MPLALVLLVLAQALVQQDAAFRAEVKSTRLLPSHLRRTPVAVHGTRPSVLRARTMLFDNEKRVEKLEDGASFFYGEEIGSTYDSVDRFKTRQRAHSLVRALEPVYGLHDAAEAGDVSAVRLLLEAGMDPEARNAKASTPLHIAALHGRDEVAEVLLSAGASASAANEDGMTPLHAAVQSVVPFSAGQRRVVQLLLARGADANASAKKVTPVFLAARRGLPELMEELLAAGATMDEEAADAAFWAAVRAVEQTPEDQGLPLEVPRLLRLVFDADLELLLHRDKTALNVTCMKPSVEGGVEGFRAGASYIFDDSDHANLPLVPGRRCADGVCCEACSRVTFPTFALQRETDLEACPDMEQFSYNECDHSSAATILMFTRLVERVRRSIAHEYGLPLSTILPLQAYSRQYVAGQQQAGGGGSEGDSVILHTDEATHAGYHYSSVLYLNTQGEDFEGGNFIWNDPLSEDAADCEDGVEECELADGRMVAPGKRVRTPLHPRRGAAVIFSSGWENMHEVEKLTSGRRFAVPCFFTTVPVPSEGVDMYGGLPAGDEEIADDMQNLMLGVEHETPMESSNRVKALFIKWHSLLAPDHA